DDTLLATGSKDETVMVWNTAQTETRPKIEGVSYPVFSADGKKMALWSQQENELTLWDAATGRQTGVIRGASFPIGFSADGSTCATGLYSNGPPGKLIGIRFWDITGGTNHSNVFLDEPLDEAY